MLTKPNLKNIRLLNTELIIENFEFPTTEDDVLEKFAPDTARTDHQNLRLTSPQIYLITKDCGNSD